MTTSAGRAFESVQYIMTRVRFGWLIRSIHSWSANLMIFTADDAGTASSVTPGPRRDAEVGRLESTGEAITTIASLFFFVRHASGGVGAGSSRSNRGRLRGMKAGKAAAVRQPKLALAGRRFTLGWRAGAPLQGS